MVKEQFIDHTYTVTTCVGTIHLTLHFYDRLHGYSPGSIAWSRMVTAFEPSTSGANALDASCNSCRRALEHISVYTGDSGNIEKYIGLLTGRRECIKIASW